MRRGVFLILPNRTAPRRTTPYENIKPKPHRRIVIIENPQRDSVLHREKHSRRRTSAMQNLIFSYYIFCYVSGHRRSCQSCLSKTHHHHGHRNHRHYDKRNRVDQLCYFSWSMRRACFFCYLLRKQLYFPHSNELQVTSLGV